MDTLKSKILVVGPKRCGKTRVANFLARHEEKPNFEVYKPTKGCRILEFEEDVNAGGRSVNLSVELWDCSGDKQYKECWSAILRDVHGVVLVYDPTIKEQERDIELWYKTYVARQLRLSDAQVILFAHQAQAGNVRSSYQAPRALDRFTFLNTTLDNDDTAIAMRDAFSTYLGAVAKATVEKSTADLEASLQVAER